MRGVKETWKFTNTHSFVFHLKCKEITTDRFNLAGLNKCRASWPSIVGRKKAERGIRRRESKLSNLVVRGEKERALQLKATLKDYSGL